jgi:hypothetical protein
MQDVLKEQLQQKSLDILTSIQNTVGQAKDFALEQLPDIAQQYVIYGRVRSIVYIVCGLILAGLAVYFGKMFTKENAKDWDKKNDGPLITGLIGGIFCGMSATILLRYGIDNGLLVWCAPKVWLIQNILHGVH